jgi:outer membrane protein
MRFSAAAALTVMLGYASLALAQTENVTLDQARNIALDKNLDVVQAEANVNAAQAGVMAAYGGYLPSLSASGGWTRTQVDRAVSSSAALGGGTLVIPAIHATSNSFSTSLGLNWTVFDGFYRQGQVGQASSHSIATEQTASRTRQSIVFQVESNYLNVLRNEQLVLVSDENLKRDQRQLERITESNRVGAASLADVYRQQSQVGNDEYQLIQAQNNFNKSKADLAALIGLDLNKEYAFVDSSISTKITKEELDSTAAHYRNFALLTQRAIAARPDYQSATESYDAASSGVVAARSGYLPSLNVFAGYGLQSDEFSALKDNKSLNWGLRINWTLFDGFGTNANVQSAIANRRIAEITVAQAEREIGAEVKKALLDLEAAMKQYEVSQSALVSAREDSKIAEERYNLGAGTLLDLLTANANLVLAQANLVNSSYGYITAKKNIEYTLGERTY